MPNLIQAMNSRYRSGQLTSYGNWLALCDCIVLVRQEVGRPYLVSPAEC